MPQLTELKPEEDDIHEYVERSEFFFRVITVRTENKRARLINYVGIASYQGVKTLLVVRQQVERQAFRDAQTPLTPRPLVSVSLRKATDKRELCGLRR